MQKLEKRLLKSLSNGKAKYLWQLVKEVSSTEDSVNRSLAELKTAGVVCQIRGCRDRWKLSPKESVPIVERAKRFAYSSVWDYAEKI